MLISPHCAKRFAVLLALVLVPAVATAATEGTNSTDATNTAPQVGTKKKLKKKRKKTDTKKTDTTTQQTDATAVPVKPAAPVVVEPVAEPVAPRRSEPARVSRSLSPLSLGAEVGALDYSALLALEIPPSGLDVGPRIIGEGMFGLLDLAPNLRLAAGGRAGFSYHGAPGGSWWLIDVVPDAKIKFAINNLISVYGDGGLGLALVHASVSAFGFSSSSTDVALALQFGGGVAYALTPKMNLLGEVRFDIYTKDGTSTFICLPTIGVQIH